jgi:ATP-dependent Clp protease ATP-binding subunit ClpA/protein subunit release factor A
MALYDDVIEQWTDDLCAQAAGGRIGPVIGREAEALALAELLAARRSVLLVGEAGVGKSSVVERMLLDAKEDGARHPAARLKVYRTSTSRLIAETKYLGEWQSKLSSLVRELQRDALSVLYLTDVWNLTSVGRSETNEETMADLLKEYVESHRISVLGEVTPDQLAAQFDRVPSFKNLFAELRVEPVPPASVRPVLENLAAHLAGSRSIAVEGAALDRAVELTDRFLPYRHQPGKAIELLERAVHYACEKARIGEPEAVSPAFVEKTFSIYSGLPLFIVSDREQRKSDEIRQFFRGRVIGQDDAIERIIETIALYKAGLNDPSRPIGTFLFVGPTGVGKTELAKALAEFLFGSESRMLRFDMSEYKDYHSFEKLIGSPNRGGATGALTEAVRKAPFAVVLLDEFEKAHANIADLFLQVFDDGRLTDGRHQTVDFRNTIIILTSNVGTDPRFRERPVRGFGEAASASADEEAEARVRRALEGAFRPEFLNRIEHIVVFRALTRETVRRIAMKELAHVYGRRGISQREVGVEVDDRLLDRVLDRGYNASYGARALKRELSRTVVVPLAIALMENAVGPGQIVRLEPKGDEGVAARVLDSDESLRAGRVEQEVAVEGRRLTLADVEAGAATLAGRVERIAAGYDLDGARARLEELRAAQEEPGFWSDQAEALASFERLNRLAAEVRRLEAAGERVAQIAARVPELRRLKDPAQREPLVRDFLAAQLAVDRLEVELTAFCEADDRPALLAIRVQGAGPGDADWLDRLADVYLAWAGAVRRPAEVLYEPTLDGDGESQVTLRVDGPYAFGYLRSEAGVHRLRAHDDREAPRKTTSALASVTVAPLDAPDPERARRVEVSGARALKARGRRLGRIRSRVTATRDGWSLGLQNARNLQENRELAVELLASAGEPVDGGSRAVRVYQLDGRAKIRDPRTELVMTGRAAEAYLQGELDAFLRRNAAALAAESGGGDG